MTELYVSGRSSNLIFKNTDVQNRDIRIAKFLKDAKIPESNLETKEKGSVSTIHFSNDAGTQRLYKNEIEDLNSKTHMLLQSFAKYATEKDNTTDGYKADGNVDKDENGDFMTYMTPDDLYRFLVDSTDGTTDPQQVSQQRVTARSESPDLSGGQTNYNNNILGSFVNLFH